MQPCLGLVEDQPRILASHQVIARKMHTALNTVACRQISATLLVESALLEHEGAIA
jgi:hypothetical protein